MTDKEKKLFIALCSFLTADKNQISLLLNEGATPALLVHLFYNRMQSVAYGVLEKYCLLGKVSREFGNSLYKAYQCDSERNKNYFRCIEMLTSILKAHEGRYAMLKGAVLCGEYPEGYRTSNDIDLLVSPDDVSVIGESLYEHGFRQGYIREGDFKSASRKEIIESKMLRGETVPYIKEVNYPWLKYMEVDINFSLDYKNERNTALKELLSRTVVVSHNDYKAAALNRTDFFIHLCCHLYKEMTTLPWIRMKRDMTLYKFTDIYKLLMYMDETSLKNVYLAADRLGVGGKCSCAILWTCGLLPVCNDFAASEATRRLRGREELLNKVFSPSDHKSYIYSEKNILNRLFSDNRMKLLKEIQ